MQVGISCDFIDKQEHMMLDLMYQTREQGDLTLVSSDKKEFKCHKDILRAQCSYFEGMFSFN